MAAPMRKMCFMPFKTFKSAYVLTNHSKIFTRCCYNSAGEDLPSKEPPKLAQYFREAAEAREGPCQIKLSLCRTSESNPANHTKDHLGLFYTVPPDEAKRWLHNAFLQDFHRMSKTFTEMCLMVREPALEVIDYLKRANYNLPAIRYLLYGHAGAGKSVQMGHIMHYCALQGYLMVHARWPPHWIHRIRGAELNPYKDRYDQPIDGVEWLTYFKNMNLDLLRPLDLRSENKYVWNKREGVEVGDSLLEAIEFGLARPKYSCDVIGMLLKEIKLAASNQKVRVFVGIEGVNSFWDATTLQKKEGGIPIIPSELTLIHNFKKLLKNDWSGGAIVGTIDPQVYHKKLKSTSLYLPTFLLGTKGFEYVDPFIPVHVPHYSDKEFISCLNYYMDRKWIQNPYGDTEAGRKELIFLTSRNPRVLREVTRIW